MVSYGIYDDYGHYGKISRPSLSVKSLLENDEFLGENNPNKAVKIIKCNT